jgi:energy-coupling factor transporter ATP-binding protein EcfA2
VGNQTLQLKNVGQIGNANIEFGDLTILVGPQASGKSIFLQMLKLVLDTGYVLDELKKHGLVWDRKVPNDFLKLYFGEGMGGIWKTGIDASEVLFNGNSFDATSPKRPHSRNNKVSLFYIPAQRVITLGRGWPRAFSDYASGDPFSVRDFSEKIRMLMEIGWGRSEAGMIFPQTKRLKIELRDTLNSAIFRGFNLRVDVQGAQKRFVLENKNSKDKLPFMVWSAGQREFVPLLMGCYWLLPPTKISRKEDVEWVVIEEPENGLHPIAISAVMLLILEILSRGYRVCISTHSPHILDVIWALKIFHTHNGAPEKLLEIFNTKKNQIMIELAKKVLNKNIRVYYFDHQTRNTRDISNLDPSSDESSEAGWGGLSEFSGRVADVVAKIVNS